MKKISLFFAVLLALASTATIAATTATESSGSEIRLKADQQKKLNTFFSNFSEVFMQPFTQGSLTDSELIRFGVAHNYRNREKLFEKLASGTKARIREKHISESVLKYLGRSIAKHQTAGEYEYRDGYYHVSEASGEMLQFSQAVHMVALGNKRYAVDVNVYSASSGWTGNVHGSPASWKKSGDDIPELTQKMKATIVEKIGTDGKPSYTLVEYIKNQ